MEYLNYAGLTRYDSKIKNFINEKVDEKLDAPSTIVNGKVIRIDEYGNTVCGEAASPAEIAEATESWLDAHISGGSTIAVDSSLTVSGAAADAESAGKVAVIQNTQPTENYNRIWVKPEDVEYSIPSYAEHQKLESRVDRLDENIDTINDILHGEAYSYEPEYTLVRGKYVDKASEYKSSDSYSMTSDIPLKKGDVITFHTRAGEACALAKSLGDNFYTAIVYDTEATDEEGDYRYVANENMNVVLCEHRYYVINVEDTPALHSVVVYSRREGGLIAIQNTQPLEDTNKIWIKDSPEEEYVVPLYDEFQEVKNAITNIESLDFPIDTSFQQLGAEKRIWFSVKTDIYENSYAEVTDDDYRVCFADSSRETDTWDLAATANATYHYYVCVKKSDGSDISGLDPSAIKSLVVIKDNTVLKTTIAEIADDIDELRDDVDANADTIEDIQENTPEFVGFKCYTESSGGDWPEGGKIEFDDNIGYIAKSDGQVKNAGTGTWLYSDFIPIDRLDGNVGEFVIHSSVANVAYYSDNSFNSYLGNISIPGDNEPTFSKTDVLSNAPTGSQYIVICTDGSRKDLYAYLTASPSVVTNIVENVPVFGQKIMHISFDDVNNAFYDLTTNADTYESLFDSPFFGVLKEMHDEYGAVFSCYCFYNVYTSDQKTTLTFSLANATTKFKNEFIENSSWLRFGFHSIDNYTTYDSNLITYETAKADWNTFVTRMADVVGINSLDTVVRLQSFAGTLNVCKGMRDALCGADGFLCSDYSETGEVKDIDTSTGYYLTSDNAGICGRKGKFEDPANGLVFFASGWRIDYQSDIPSWLALFNTADRFNRRRYMMIYGHENNMTSSSANITAYRTKLITICNWAKTNNYKFVFPADLIVY